MRYFVCLGGESEPGLLLVLDEKSGLIVARSSELARSHLEELVRLVNAGTKVEAEVTPTIPPPPESEL
jgi:hypothetical protein